MLVGVFTATEIAVMKDFFQRFYSIDNCILLDLHTSQKKKQKGKGIFYQLKDPFFLCEEKDSFDILLRVLNE